MPILNPENFCYGYSELMKTCSYFLVNPDPFFTLLISDNLR